ncbi:TlpA family protein disulfide reductase [Methylohalobius crimeensis]|uniref:TlpA family protein disulfide reductase n=1 Tax=Methylohalobius crimeensis TaxID=244365 RepID=UPI0004046A68|nr:hypothetical protein [Methylohalobius crimeensis]
MLLRLFVVVLLLTGLPPVCANAPRLFSAGSMEEIRDRHRAPFLLILWSLDCPPCRRELKLLGETLQANPKLDLVLIATDGETRAEEAEQLLARYDLDQTESWIFRTANDMRLRYEIDPGWYGELPRSYFYLPDGKRVGYSGPLKPKQIEAWLRTLSQSSEWISVPRLVYAKAVRVEQKQAKCLGNR